MSSRSKWKQCRNCKQLEWCQTTCARCLNRLREEVWLKGELDLGPTEQCSVEWCEFDSATPGGACSSHEGEQEFPPDMRDCKTLDRVSDELSIPMWRLKELKRDGRIGFNGNKLVRVEDWLKEWAEELNEGAGEEWMLSEESC